MSNQSELSFTHRAAVTALPFTLVPILFDIAKHFTQEMAILSIAVGFIKVGTITAILNVCMKKFTMDEGYVPYGRAFKFGFSLCTFSSIICTLWFVLNVYVIFPDQLDKLYESLTTALGRMDTGIEYDQIVRFMPPALIVSSFINCEIWGLILSSILANYTKNDSPFIEDGVQEDEHKIEEE